MRLISFILVPLVLFFAACGGSGSTSSESLKGSAKPTAVAPKEPAGSILATGGTAMLVSVLGKYYDLKDALVATNAVRADSAAAQLGTMTGILSRFAETDTAHTALLKPYIDTILMQCKVLPAMEDKTCEKQRIVFDHISSAVYGLIKAAGLKHAGVFHEFCPMAFNDRGAFWLSNESDIQNPYFGKKMLECGEVTDSL